MNVNVYDSCDVTHTAYRLMMIPQLHHVLSSLEVFSVMVAAIGHDVSTSRTLHITYLSLCSLFIHITSYILLHTHYYT